MGIWAGAMKSLDRTLIGSYAIAAAGFVNLITSEYHFISFIFGTIDGPDLYRLCE